MRTYCDATAINAYWGHLPPKGKASKYIGWAKKAIKRGDRVILCIRVSYHTQWRNGNLASQEMFLRREMAKLGAIVIDVVRKVGNGWDGPWLVEAAETARKHRAKLVAVCTNRLIRHLDYNSKTNPHAQAAEIDLDCLAAWTIGVPLATVLHPDATAPEEKSLLTKIGQWAKGNRGGRPAKGVPGSIKERRGEKLPVVLDLHAQGLPVRRIAEEVGVAKSTVQDWVRGGK